jgi:protein-disulfide isomerase
MTHELLKESMIQDKRKNRRATVPAVLGAVMLVLGACAELDVRAEPLELTAGTSSDIANAGPTPPSPAPAPAAPADTVDLRRIGYAEGAADAPVTVIEFSDFGCPFCAMFAQGSYPELRREFIATGRVRWVFVPFVMGMFPNGAEAARAGECAGEQDRFREMKLRIYAGQNEWKSSRNATSVFAGYARELGLDEARFASCYREDRGGTRTRANNRAADALGVRATPSFLVNGRLVEGALPLLQFRMILTRLAEAAE